MRFFLFADFVYHFRRYFFCCYFSVHKSVIFPAYPIWSALDATWYTVHSNSENRTFRRLSIMRILTTKKFSLALIQHKHEHVNRKMGGGWCFWLSCVPWYTIGTGQSWGKNWHVRDCQLMPLTSMMWQL